MILGKPIMKAQFEKPFQQFTKYSTKLHQMVKDKYSLNFVPEDLVPLVNAADEEGRTCIHLLVLSSAKAEEAILSEIRLLESYGARLDSEDDTNSTPLHYAIKKNYFQISEYLIERTNMNVNIANMENETPLYLAVSVKAKKIVEKLLKKHEIDVNFPIGSNDNCLKKCIRIGQSNLNVLNLLLNHPSIDVNSVGDKRKTECRGRTPLHEAVACGNFEIVKNLIEKNANLNSKDFKKRSPLFCAIENNRTHIALFLLQNTSSQDLEEEDEDGMTVSQFAREKGLYELASMIEQKCVKKENKEKKPSNKMQICGMPNHPYYSIQSETYSVVEQKPMKNKVMTTPNKMAVYSVQTNPYYNVSNGSYPTYGQNFQIPETVPGLRKSKKRKMQWEEEYPKNTYFHYQQQQAYPYENQMNYNGQYGNQQNQYPVVYQQEHCPPSIQSPYNMPEEVQYPYYQQKGPMMQCPTSEPEYQGNQQYVFNNYQVYIQQNYPNPYHVHTSPRMRQSPADSSVADTSGYGSDPSVVGHASPIRHPAIMGDPSTMTNRVMSNPSPMSNPSTMSNPPSMVNPSLRNPSPMMTPAMSNPSPMMNPPSMSNPSIRDPSAIGDSSSFGTYADLFYQCTKLDTDQFFKKIIQ